jgi:N-acetylneuraminic acid mutarotase
MASLAGRNYLIGGSEAGTNVVEVYDPVTNTWTTAPSLPQALHHVQPVVVQGKIYVIGGLVTWPGPSVATVRAFDPANVGLGWQTRAAMPTARGAAGCAADGIKIYCAGGLSTTDNNTAIAAMEVYNTVTNQWQALAPMPRERDHFHAAIVNGKFYAIAGRNTAINATFSFNDVYDIATNTWTQAAALPTQARGGYANAVVEGRILVIGGEGAGALPGTFGNVDEYDPARNTWRALTNMPTPRHGVGAAVNAAEDGATEKVYVATGGPVRGSSKTDVHEVFAYGTDGTSSLVCFAAGGTAPAGTFGGAMTTGTQFTAGADDDPLLDNLTSPLVFANSSVNSTSSGGSPDKVTYTVVLPSSGAWHLWGRFYYPVLPGTNDANSFHARLDAQALKKFGNNKDFHRKWHWGGDGNKETGTPTAIALGNLSAGNHTLVIEKREVTPTPPRLDVLCFSTQATTPPSDAEACDAGACPPLGSTTTLPPETTTTLSQTTTTLPAFDGVCVPAGISDPAVVFAGNMTTSTQFTGGADADPARNNLTSPLVFANSTTNSSSGGSGDKVTYTLDLPSAGPWYLWGRFYYPVLPATNGANSFFARLDAQTLKKFGNNKDFHQKWHWGGDGNQETGTPAAIALGSPLPGSHTLVVEKREVTPSPPRLDVFCLTHDGITPPTDAEALAGICALIGCP